MCKNTRPKILTYEVLQKFKNKLNRITLKCQESLMSVQMIINNNPNSFSINKVMKINLMQMYK
jgi:hypothetical protein